MGFTTSYWQKEQWSRRAADMLTSYARCWNPSLGNWDVNWSEFRSAQQPNTQHQGKADRPHAMLRFLAAAPAILRRHLKHCSIAISAASEGCAVEIPRPVKDQAAPRKGPIPTSAKVVENRLRPARWRQLKHCAGGTGAAAASGGRAVEIPVRVHDQAGIGMDPIYVIVLEAVENCLRPRRHQLKHRAFAVSAAIGGRAVEIPHGVQNHTAYGIGPIRTISETPENCLRPRRRQLKHRALVVSAAMLGRAVEIPLRVQDHTGQGIGPIRAISEIP